MKCCRVAPALGGGASARARLQEAHASDRSIAAVRFSRAAISRLPVLNAGDTSVQPGWPGWRVHGSQSGCDNSLILSVE